MIDRILLAPYFIALKFRHFLYDSGIMKVHKADIPTISVGNITAGGTGKTPHTEMILRTLLEANYMKDRKTAVLSRGYRRKSKGFQQVVEGGSCRDFGDEPLQIKNKFPEVTVAVDSSRVEGCDFLRHPEKLQTSPKAKKCIDRQLSSPDVIILDDAFQYRALKPDISIVLIDYNRPVFKDKLLPMGRLRDLKERIYDADILIVSKCPSYIDELEKGEWASRLGFSDLDIASCSGTNIKGKQQHIFFTSVTYDDMQPVFPEGDSRYLYAKRVILFSGIANDIPLRKYLSGTYKVVKHFIFGDHHNFTKKDIRKIKDVSFIFPTAIIATTEKDSQRIREMSGTPSDLRERMFMVPIKTVFLSEKEKAIFGSILKDCITKGR